MPFYFLSYLRRVPHWKITIEFTSGKKFQGFRTYPDQEARDVERKVVNKLRETNADEKVNNIQIDQVGVLDPEFVAYRKKKNNQS